MQTKSLQIMLVLAAVLCAVGIFAGLGGGRHLDAETFQPPAWLKALSGLAGGPKLAAEDLRDSGMAWNDSLTLAGAAWRQFSVSRSEEDVRRVAFTVKGPGRDRVSIRYQPKSGQRLNGEQVKAQHWPNDEGSEANFVVYDGGGTFLFQNAGSRQATILLED